MAEHDHRMQSGDIPGGVTREGEPAVLIARRDPGVMTVTLNRSQCRNAMNDEMYVRLDRAWADAEEDSSVRVVVVTGRGGAFSAGADLGAMAAGPEDDTWSIAVERDDDLIWRSLLRERTLTKPVVAAIEGAAVAGGTELLQGTDIRVAGSSAFFGLPEPQWGIMPMGGSTVRLRRQVPYAKAMDLLLTGRFIGAPEALEIGLLSRVVTDGDALEEAQSIANKIAGHGPLAVQGIMRSVLATSGLREIEALEIELGIGREVMDSDDAREGPRAFSERRQPRFEGR